MAGKPGIDSNVRKEVLGLSRKIPMELHPSEADLIRFIRELRYGTIQNLHVQDGLPVAAEEVRGKVRFGTTSGRTEVGGEGRRQSRQS